MHTNMAGVLPDDVWAALTQNVLGTGGPRPSGFSSARLYWENTVGFFNVFNVKNVSLPAAVSVFPHEIYKAPRCSPASCAPRSGPCARGPNGR